MKGDGGRVAGSNIAEEFIASRQYRGGVYCTVANTGECSYAPLATAYKFVNSFVVIAYFLLHDESNQAVIATLHEIDERDHREEDTTIKQTRFPQN